MLQKILCFVFIVATCSACYDDIGNYTYKAPEEPVVNGLTGKKFVAYVGDSLIIKPQIKHSLVGTENLQYDWEIAVSTELRGDFFKGPVLRMAFGYRPAIYIGRFTITDKTNGMKYYYNFSIDGRTEFSKGTMVLSNDGGVGKLSFIKPGDVLKTNLYEVVNHESLPSNPIQIEMVTYPQPGFDAYWILTGEVNKPGVIINPDYLSRTFYIQDKFFSVPEPVTANRIQPGYYAPGIGSGVTSGIYNDKLYIGTSSTAPYNPTFGDYGNAIAGDYHLAPSYIYQLNQYTVGYDKVRKRFVMFDPALVYKGTSYDTAIVGSGFDPYYVGYDLITMKSLNGQATYAFLKDDDGIVHEAKFFNQPNRFITYYMREFAGSSLVKEDSRWDGSYLEILYFSSDDKIYRYNPINEELKELVTTFNGKHPSMVQLSDDANMLIVGVEGSLYYLDVSTGKSGEVLKTINGIPGAPVDILIRK